MKKMNFLAYVLLSLIAITGFSSCSSDDEKAPFSPDLLGNTKMYVYKEECYLKGELVRGHFSPEYWYFESNGTCRGFSTGEWKMKGSSIMVTTHWSGLTETHEYKIIKSEMEEDRHNWEIVLRREYEDDEYDYQLYYMRFEGLIR